MRWSIRWQLLVPLLTLLAGVVGMSAWTALASADRAAQQIEKQMKGVADTIGSVSFPRNLQTLKLMKGLSGAEFLLTAGPVSAKPSAPPQLLTTLPSLPGRLPEPGTSWQGFAELPRIEAGGETYFCQGIHLGTQESPWVLYIFYSEALWRDAIWEAVRPSLYVGIIGGLASLVLTVAVAGRFSRRIGELEWRTRLIAGGDFSPMPLPRRNDELRDLGQCVNDMAQRLAHLQETVQTTERLRLLGQVSGGLAHQLRNGVTGARLAVQLHAQDCNGRADAESLDVALRQLALVETHLRRFLDLGRVADLRREPVSIVGLLEETMALLRPQCRHVQTELCWQAPSFAAEPQVQGDRGQLDQLLLNVLTNAVEAAGPRGQVEVRLDCQSSPRAIRDQKSAIIEVWDSGPGPPAHIAGRLFEPFVSAKPEGVGLGLAVARQIARAHGGDIRWRRENDRTCFTIDLPLMSPALMSNAPS